MLFHFHALLFLSNSLIFLSILFFFLTLRIQNAFSFVAKGYYIKYHIMVRWQLLKM